MNNRIKEVLQDSKLTQVKFADRIGISRTGLQKLITGENNPSEQTIRAICDSFGVNRAWLEKGELPKERVQADADIAKFMALMATGSENKKELVRLILDMPDELIDAFTTYMENRAKKNNRP